MLFYPTLDADSVRGYLPAIPFLLPVSSWARQPRMPDGGLRVPRIPPQVPALAADSGGFLASVRAKKLGLDDGYRYRPEQYVAWLQALGPRLSWAATFDYRGSQDRQQTREAQERTTERAWHFWQRFRHTGIIWVPTLQGWLPEEYRRHARDLRPLLEQMACYYGLQSAWRVGVGGLTQRSAEVICQVCAAVAEELPCLPLHAWGLSLRMLHSPVMLPRQVISCDSSSWNWRYGRDLEACRTSGLSVRQWAITVALPRYQAAMEAGWSSPKQLALAWQPEHLIDHHRKRRSRPTWPRQDSDGAFFCHVPSGLDISPAVCYHSKQPILVYSGGRKGATNGTTRLWAADLVGWQP